MGIDHFRPVLCCFACRQQADVRAPSLVSILQNDSEAILLKNLEHLASRPAASRRLSSNAHPVPDRLQQ
jgi:hypothetical protein